MSWSIFPCLDTAPRYSLTSTRSPVHRLLRIMVGIVEEFGQFSDRIQPVFLPQSLPYFGYQSRMSAKYYQRISVQGMNIFVGPGGYYICYYLGFFQKLFDELGRDFFKDTSFEGVSAGGQLSGYAVAATNGAHDMLYWYKNGPRDAMASGCWPGQLTVKCYESGKRFYLDAVSQNEDIEKHIFHKYAAWGTTSSGKPYKLRNIRDHIDFGNSVASTGNIPVLGAINPWRFKGEKLWDGGIAYSACLEAIVQLNTNTIIFCINIPDNFENTHKATVFEFSKWRPFKRSIGIGLLFYTKKKRLKKMDELFENGYEDAGQHIDELVRVLKSHRWK